MRAMSLLPLLAACSSPALVPHPRPPLAAHDHVAEAERHEAEARALDEHAAAVERSGTPSQYACGDVALTEMATSGSERLRILPPCWSGEVGAIERDRTLAAHLRADARLHRAKARTLVTAKQQWCAGLPASELDHTPFDHREDIVAVRAELEGDRLRGARIRFAKVPGLTADWLRQALACHQAIAAATGYDPTQLASCPSVVAGATTTVLEHASGLEVIVRAADQAAALVIYGRAEALLDAHIDD
jgi:hypothetical protein